MISAVVHTYNEEKNIARCLSSLKWVDEIIVIDMGSSDKTCDIVSEFQARVFQHPHTGFVEPARNFGLQKAKGDWIIIVDADEEIPAKLANFLRGSSNNDNYDYYRIPRQNYIFGKWIKHTGWWPDYQIRFFRKGKVTWSDKIHGIPITCGKGQDIEAIDDLSIIHNNYQSIEQYIGRLNRYTSVSAKELFLTNNRFSIDQLFQIPTREFVNRYFVWEGYKDGIHGLALSFLQSFSELVTYLKLWDLENFKEKKITLTEIDKNISSDYKIKQYWLIQTLLKEPVGIFKMFFLKIKRKIGSLLYA